MPKCSYKERMTYNVKFKFSVGDTTRAVYNWYWARQNEMVTPKTIFSVARPSIGHKGIVNELSSLIL